MFNWLRSSLPARAGLAVILIAILALASSLSAGLIAWFSQGDAAAINTAGFRADRTRSPRTGKMRQTSGACVVWTPVVRDG